MANDDNDDRSEYGQRRQYDRHAATTIPPMTIAPMCRTIQRRSKLDPTFRKTHRDVKREGMEDPTLTSNKTTMGIGVEPLGSAPFFFSTLYLMYAQIQGRLGPWEYIYTFNLSHNCETKEIVSVL